MPANLERRTVGRLLRDVFPTKPSEPAEESVMEPVEPPPLSERQVAWYERLKNNPNRGGYGEPGTGTTLNKWLNRIGQQGIEALVSSRNPGKRLDDIINRVMSREAANVARLNEYNVYGEPVTSVFEGISPEAIKRTIVEQYVQGGAPGLKGGLPGYATWLAEQAGAGRKFDSAADRKTAYEAEVYNPFYAANTVPTVSFNVDQLRAYSPPPAQPAYEPAPFFSAMTETDAATPPPGSPSPFLDVMQPPAPVAPVAPPVPVAPVAPPAPPVAVPSRPAQYISYYSQPGTYRGPYR